MNIGQTIEKSHRRESSPNVVIQSLNNRILLVKQQTSTKCEDAILQTLMRCSCGRSLAIQRAMMSPSRYSSKQDVCDDSSWWGCCCCCWWCCAVVGSDSWRLCWVSCWWLNSQSSVKKLTKDLRLSFSGTSSNNLPQRHIQITTKSAYR